MRIAQVCHLFPPATGGIEHHTYEIAKHLATEGDEVTIFTTSLPGTAKQESLEGFKIRRFFSLNFPLFSSVRFPPALFFSLINSDFDIYCSHGYGSLMPFITSLAAFMKKKPFVFTLHGYPKLKGFSGLFQAVYRIFFASVFLRIASKIIVVSKASVNDIRGEIDEKKVVYIPNGIVAEDFSCETYVPNDTITYVGRLDKYKGVDLLLYAYARMLPKYPEIKLRVVGRDEGIKHELEALAAKLKINVEFSNVPYSEMKSVYCNSKLIVLPSKYEGFSLVWLEAIASGRPMFSTHVGDAPYLFEQVYGADADKFLFKDEDELVKKLYDFMEKQKDLEKTIKKAEYICKEEYSWENVSAITKNVYSGVLGNEAKK
jgi:glycosyltransferase involved in cell wall biosynthesis